MPRMIDKSGRAEKCSCGFSPDLFYETRTGKRFYYYRCVICNAKTGLCHSRKEAAEVWNRGDRV